MPFVATHSDALRLTASSVRIVHLTAVGTIPGVVVDAVAARNGPGTGRLRATGDGSELSWQAPDSAVFGAIVNVDPENDASYLLEDGEDTGKYVIVDVYPGYLVDGGAEAAVELADVYENAVANDDVTASEASSGDVTAHTIDMDNDGTVILSQLKVWIDSDVAGLEISDDGASWVSPTAEGSALDFPDLSPGDSDTLHLRRTIGASTASDDEVLNHIHISYCGV